MQALPFHQTLLTIFCLYPFVLFNDGCTWLYEKGKGFLVTCLVVSNLSALQAFWAVQAYDYWIGTGIITMMLLSMGSHALEVLPNFLDHPLYKRANQVDRVFQWLLIALITLRLGGAHQVPIAQLLLDNWGLVVVTLLLALLNFCSVKLRATRQPEMYTIYVLFHSAWHFFIYRVLAQFLTLALSGK